MVPELGNFALILAMLLALIQGTLPLIGAARGIPAWIAIARPVVQGQFVFIAIAFGCLAYSFVNNDFSVLNVASHSNSEFYMRSCKSQHCVYNLLLINKKVFIFVKKQYEI